MQSDTKKGNLLLFISAFSIFFALILWKVLEASVAVICKVLELSLITYGTLL